MKKEELLKAYLDEAIRIRRELHQIPEEGFNLPKTHEYIMSY